jgi:hypothetical protein
MDNEGPVILDITVDRATPVIPGKGSIPGDGRKLVPTPGQLRWIAELWEVDVMNERPFANLSQFPFCLASRFACRRSCKACIAR